MSYSSVLSALRSYLFFALIARKRSIDGPGRMKVFRILKSTNFNFNCFTNRKNGVTNAECN